jgi:hypothetical protein
MKYIGTVHTSAHEELRTNSLVKGKRPEQYDGNPGLKWLLVKLTNGVSRRILVKSLRKIK